MLLRNNIGFRVFFLAVVVLVSSTEASSIAVEEITADTNAAEMSQFIGDSRSASTGVQESFKAGYQAGVQEAKRAHPTSSAPSKLPTNQPSEPPSATPTVGSTAPTAKPTAAPSTAKPTNQPSGAPTKQPTGAPTNHPCKDGSHGCDSGPGGICVTKEANKWACACKSSHKCVAGCTAHHKGHKCVITSTPTGAPTKGSAAPTRAPSTPPTQPIEAPLQFKNKGDFVKYVEREMTCPNNGQTKPNVTEVSCATIS